MMDVIYNILTLVGSVCIVHCIMWTWETDLSFSEMRWYQKGKVIAAKDECSNVFAGIDLVEAKLTGQIRRYKLEVQPHRQKRGLKNLFIRRK